MKIRPKVEQINELLIRKGLTRRALADLAQIGLATATQVCNGNRKPSSPTARKISTALNVDFDEIFIIEK